MKTVRMTATKRMTKATLPFSINYVKKDCPDRYMDDAG